MPSITHEPNISLNAIKKMRDERKKKGIFKTTGAKFLKGNYNPEKCWQSSKI